MQKEIEIKILEINVEEMHRKLIRLGARKIDHCLVHERIYDFPNNRIKKKDDIFRIRQCGKRTEVTYKSNSQKDEDFLEHDEYETTVANFDTMCKIAELLGMEVVKDREKKRTSYIWRNVKFEIDKYPTIPPYLEIEATKKDIKIALKKLGYSMKDTTNMASTKVLKYYKKNPNYQTFSRK